MYSLILPTPICGSIWISENPPVSCRTLSNTILLTCKIVLMAEWFVCFFRSWYFHKLSLFLCTELLLFLIFQILSYQKHIFPTVKNLLQVNFLYLRWKVLIALLGYILFIFIIKRKVVFSKYGIVIACEYSYHSLSGQTKSERRKIYLPTEMPPCFPQSGFFCKNMKFST